MRDLCILFCHHRDCPTTRRHLAVLREANPAVPVVPLVCDDGGGADGVAGAGRVPRAFDRGMNWHNFDRILAAWGRGEIGPARAATGAGLQSELQILPPSRILHDLGDHRFRPGKRFPMRRICWLSKMGRAIACRGLPDIPTGR